MANEKREKIDYDKARTIAESLYIDNDMDGREIASLLKVSEVTISRWKKEDEWDEKKNFLNITPSRLRIKMIQEADKVSRGQKCTIDADSISKLLAGADRLAKKTTPEVIHAVLKECCNYISTIDPKSVMQMAKNHRLFLQYKIETEG